MVPGETLVSGHDVDLAGRALVFFFHGVANDRLCQRSYCRRLVAWINRPQVCGGSAGGYSWGAQWSVELGAMATGFPVYTDGRTPQSEDDSTAAMIFALGL